jgi:alkylated DNA nucleotide flippase Atl1
MKTYQMAIRTERINENGRMKIDREIIQHIPEGEVESYRDAARTSAPLGSTRTIKVTEQRFQG